MATLDYLVSDDVRAQLDRMEATLKKLDQRVADINGKVRDHDQTLYGIGRLGTGLEARVAQILDRVGGMPLPGYVSAKVMWSALGSIAVIAGVVVALVLGLR